MLWWYKSIPILYREDEDDQHYLQVQGNSQQPSILLDDSIYFTVQDTTKQTLTAFSNPAYDTTLKDSKQALLRHNPGCSTVIRLVFLQACLEERTVTNYSHDFSDLAVHQRWPRNLKTLWMLSINNISMLLLCVCSRNSKNSSLYYCVLLILILCSVIVFVIDNSILFIHHNNHICCLKKVWSCANHCSCVNSRAVWKSLNNRKSDNCKAHLKSLTQFCVHTVAPITESDNMCSTVNLPGFNVPTPQFLNQFQRVVVDYHKGEMKCRLPWWTLPWQA